MKNLTKQVSSKKIKIKMNKHIIYTELVTSIHHANELRILISIIQLIVHRLGTAELYIKRYAFKCFDVFNSQ